MKCVILGGERKFRAFLEAALGEAVTEVASLSEALSAVADVLFILPCYDLGELVLPEMSEDESEMLARLVYEGKTKIFIEGYPSFDYRDKFILGVQAKGPITPFGKNSITLCGELSSKIGYEILQRRGGYYYPADIRPGEKISVLCEVKNCLGTKKVLSAEKKHAADALYKKGDALYVSMTDLTNLKSYEIFPYRAWAGLYANVFSEILGVNEDTVLRAFLGAYKKIETKGKNVKKSRHEALEEAVADALSWHENAGILIDGGRRGVYEMIRSFDLKIAKNKRGDSSLLTAVLFSAMHKYLGNEKYARVSADILHHTLDELGLQLSEGKNRGLFKWFSGIGGLGCTDVYLSDTSRVGNSVFALYKLTENEALRPRLDALGEALLSWFGGEALVPVCNFKYDRDDLESIQSDVRALSPEFYDAPMLFFRNMYLLTGDERYKEQIFKTATKIALAYPSYDALASHSDNFTYSRTLAVLAVAQSLGEGEWTPLIDTLLNYFKNVQHKMGGFADGRAYYDEASLSSDMEFAVGFGDGDSIADMVYCQNTMAYALTVLKSAEGSFDKALAESMRERLIDFLLLSQIKCEDNRFSGAWMRAFDMESGEYYGCDKDFAWGPYCVLAGWVTGIIPLVMLDELGVKTMY